MNSFELEFDHLGLAVRQEDEALKFLKGLGYEIGEKVHDLLQEVNVIYCRSESCPNVEVIFPADEQGPLDAILKTNAELIYHTCYSTKHIERSLQLIQEQGHRVICVSPPKEAILFGHKRVSFYLIRGFGVVELLEV